jgi:hypothetical protein
VRRSKGVPRCEKICARQKNTHCTSCLKLKLLPCGGKRNREHFKIFQHCRQYRQRVQDTVPLSEAFHNTNWPKCFHFPLLSPCVGLIHTWDQCFPWKSGVVTCTASAWSWSPKLIETINKLVLYPALVVCRHHCHPQGFPLTHWLTATGTEACTLRCWFRCHFLAFV